MRKLKLELDALAVESFATQPAASKKGTVIGLGYFNYTYAWENTCDEKLTCGFNCVYTNNNADTCGGEDTCDATCQAPIKYSLEAAPTASLQG